MLLVAEAQLAIQTNQGLLLCLLRGQLCHRWVPEDKLNRLLLKTVDSELVILSSDLHADLLSDRVVFLGLGLPTRKRLYHSCLSDVGWANDKQIKFLHLDESGIRPARVGCLGRGWRAGILLVAVHLSVYF